MTRVNLIIPSVRLWMLVLLLLKLTLLNVIKFITIIWALDEKLINEFDNFLSSYYSSWRVNRRIYTCIINRSTTIYGQRNNDYHDHFPDSTCFRYTFIPPWTTFGGFVYFVRGDPNENIKEKISINSSKNTWSALGKILYIFNLFAH